MRRFVLTAAAALGICALGTTLALRMSNPAWAITPTVTPTSTATPPAGIDYVYPNLTGIPADGVDINSFGSAPISMSVNAAGCPAPTQTLVVGPIITIEVDPGFPITGPTYTLQIRWPSACADPNEFIHVHFNSSPIASVADFLPGFPGPGPTDLVALDCDTATAGIQDDCTVALGQASVDVDVIYRTSFATQLGAFNFEVRDADTTRLNPPLVPAPGLGLDSNPDFNQSILGSAPFDCHAPAPDNDNGAGGAGTAQSFIGCYKSAPGTGAPVAPLALIRLATVHYNIPPGALPGSVPLSLKNVAIYDFPSISELGSCNPVLVSFIDCFGATIRLVPSPGVEKQPEGNTANADLSVPKANLWICQAPALCAGPGEGNLRVVEHASSVFSDYDRDGVADMGDPCICTDFGPDGVPNTGDDTGSVAPPNTELGLGAYEFSIEYDNFVIQSVNPCDIVFGPGGAGATRGPVDELDASSPANADCSPDPGGANKGTCAMSLVLENVIHFGCVTNGPVQGPSGDFALASLNLIPHPDLRNDLFPGNSNGVLTVLKDNGCELADRLGHPVAGSVNGGLTPVCGDLAVTVRILEGDLNLDCNVDITDEQLISFRYGAFFGDLYYQKWFDLEPGTHDLDIDIKDLQKVFGRDGSTCQAPVPDQFPVDPPAPFGD